MLRLTDRTDCTDFFAKCYVLLPHGDDGVDGFCEHGMLTLLLARYMPVAKYVSTYYVVKDLSTSNGLIAK